MTHWFPLCCHLLLASGDHDWRSNKLPGIMQIIPRGHQFECYTQNACEILNAIYKFTSASIESKTEWEVIFVVKKCSHSY